MQERPLSIGEVTAHLGVNPDTVNKPITREKMFAPNLRRLWRLLATEVDEWVKGGHAAEDVAPPGRADTPKHKRPRH